MVALGRAPYTNWLGLLQPEDRKIVDNAIQLVGMSGYAEKTMDKMSDGECQRIMIARALAQDTPVILLDEPTAFLDLPNRYELCLLLKKLAQEEGKCILFSTHDLDIALSLCDSIMLIDNPYMYPILRHRGYCRVPSGRAGGRIGFVGVDAHIDPAVETDFTKIPGEFVRALGAMWASPPTRWRETRCGHRPTHF